MVQQKIWIHILSTKQTRKGKTKLNIQMTLLIKIFLILLALAIIFIVIMLTTSQPYPKELEKIDDEKIIDMFKKHKN